MSGLNGLKNYIDLTCDSKADTYLTKLRFRTHSIKNMYEDETNIYRKLMKNNFENYLIFRRISATKLLLNIVEMNKSLITKTMYRKARVDDNYIGLKLINSLLSPLGRLQQVLIFLQEYRNNFTDRMWRPHYDGAVILLIRTLINVPTLRVQSPHFSANKYIIKSEQIQYVTALNGLNPWLDD